MHILDRRAAVLLMVTPAVLAVVLALPLSPAVAQPQIPATFYGTASIDGRVPPPTADIRAVIDGIDCTQLGPSARFVVDGGVGKYVVSVIHESQREGCLRCQSVIKNSELGHANRTRDADWARPVRDAKRFLPGRSSLGHQSKLFFISTLTPSLSPQILCQS